ncbi:type I-C CRISPR-associated endonuclease Cas1c [Salipiger sp. P9]|uniref:type I-C CRISPR-associated endonuclease Cas1c n=1 Tax=Salipiger pentaromativorans TaxID=2943193 RepID=UPI002157AE89|nr:type I-C CRISPR-associated endonuclease Cas1c [Salipiger pentaromativorans]MCR8547613.1 type I-C CRISPR-associated endonuclease Cas1c [Salipiger pentaromativorans]
MKKLLNTLYVTSEGAALRKDGQNVVVAIDGHDRGRAPAHLLGQIVCFAQATISPPLMAFCAESGISIAYLSTTGRFLARVEGPQSGNVLLRRAQHKASDSPALALPVAQSVVAAKAANQRGLLRRVLRDYGKTMDPAPFALLDTCERRLSDAARLALDAPDLETLRGQEGEAANAYFTAFPQFIRNPGFSFANRSRRPPLDPVNAVLSLLYALLAQDCRAACETHGLDPQMGFLHRDRPGRMSLALDLMEEFRAPLADRTCLTLLNRRQLSAGDFRFEETGAVLLSDDGRETVLKAWQERKRETVRHPFFEETAPLGLFPQMQAQLLARHLRGELDGYPAWIWR